MAQPVKCYGGLGGCVDVFTVMRSRLRDEQYCSYWYSLRIARVYKWALWQRWSVGLIVKRVLQSLRMSIKQGIILRGTDCVVMIQGPAFPQNVTKWDRFDTNVNYAYLTKFQRVRAFSSAPFYSVSFVNCVPLHTMKTVQNYFSGH